MKLGLLVLTSGKQEGKLLEIKLPQFLIGRDPQCQLRPASPLISKRHCAIIQRDGKVFVRDFDSTNGTFVNDDPVKGEVELKHDDALKVGPIQFKISIQPGEAPSRTPAPPTKASTNTPIPPTKALPVNPAVGKPGGSETPPPATSLSATGSAKPPTGEEDDIAAMLLSLEDGEVTSVSGGADQAVPEGSTVFDLKVPPDVAAGGAKGDDKKGTAAKQASTGDTRSAAARILEKMTKRPRT